MSASNSLRHRHTFLLRRHPTPHKTAISAFHIQLHTHSNPAVIVSRTMASATTFYDFKPNDAQGKPFPLVDLKGKVILVVNTASKCGFTPQLDGLQALYKDVKATNPSDFEILGFPCNQFGGQDPGSNDEIQNFCVLNYKTEFKVLGKTEVNGDNTEPVYKWMKEAKPGILGLQRIKWNFEKFLIGRDGLVKARWASTTKPESIKADILKELKASAPTTKTSAEKPTPTSA